MDELKKKYLKKLQSYKEDDFTREIIAPLFEAMGYQRVEFNGGPYERGRDLIATIKIPPSRTPKVIYIQSKKIENQKRDNSRILSDLGHQIRQSCRVGYKTLDGITVNPSEIYITCPEVVTQRFLEEIQDQFLTNIDIPIHIMDGQVIIENIDLYDRDIFKKLDTTEDKITSKKHKNGNEDLLNALKSKRKNVDIQEFYSDLSFFVGSLDSNILMHLNISFMECTLSINPESWGGVKKIHNLIKNEFEINLLDKKPEQIDSDYQDKIKKFNSTKNKSTIKELKLSNDRYNTIHSRVLLEVDDILTNNDALILRENNKGSNKTNLLSDISNSMRELKKCISQNNLELPEPKLPNELYVKYEKYALTLKEKYSTIQSIISELSILSAEINLLKKAIINEPSYEVKISFKELYTEIKRLKEQYLSGVQKINKKELKFIEIKKFLRQTERTLNLLSIIKDRDEIKIFIRDLSITKNDDRVAISPIDVFSTNFDIAVYGGAGVGKTTTVEAYYNHLDEDKRRIKILIPLNRLASKITDGNKTIQTKNEKDTPENDVKNLIYRLILCYKEVEINKATILEVSKILSEKSTTIILDGIDEVYNIIPQLLNGINHFKEKHPEVQLIVTSRDCVSYLDKINFLGITLLPFSENQIKEFIDGWFKNAPELSIKLFKNISERNLFDYVKTPLILTITCNLVEKGIDAPSTESEIYDARFSLLTGEYDKFKKVERQNNPGQLLKKISTRLAYIMHTKNIRAISRLKAKNELTNSFGGHFSEELLDSLLNDLIDPCNILLHDKFSNTLSFGHFRFQEHLASLELSTNRSLNMADLTRSDWWRGALCLYAQSNDMEFLIDEVYQKFQSLGRSEITLRAMQKQTLPHRRKVIETIINQTKKLDIMDEIYTDIYHEETYY